MLVGIRFEKDLTSMNGAADDFYRGLIALSTGIKIKGTRDPVFYTTGLNPSALSTVGSTVIFSTVGLIAASSTATAASS
jgi:hypothetical protein